MMGVLPEEKCAHVGSSSGGSGGLPALARAFPTVCSSETTSATHHAPRRNTVPEEFILLQCAGDLTTGTPVFLCDSLCLVLELPAEPVVLSVNSIRCALKWFTVFCAAAVRAYLD
jgi:hypothetical protein